METRYQDCAWYEKLWRLRWYLLIPLDAVQIWLNCKNSADAFSIKDSWDLAVGFAQVKMNWLYEMEEVFNEKDN